MVHISRINGSDPFNDGNEGWWGYRITLPDSPPLDYWVLGADYLDIGDGYIQREAVSERLGDGRDPFECDDPHPDSYYDSVWNRIVADLHHSGHPSL